MSFPSPSRARPTAVQAIPFLFLVACMDHTLTVLPGDATDGPGSAAVDIPTESTASSFRGTVSVIPAYTDEDGALVEMGWDEANDGVFPFGAIWVDTFTVDPATGARVHGDEMAILEPETDLNVWTLDFSVFGQAPIYLQAVLDKEDDGILGIAEPSALWHEPLQVSGEDLVNPEGEVVEALSLYITVPWRGPARTFGGEDGSGGGSDGWTPAEAAEAMGETMQDAIDALVHEGNDEADEDGDSMVLLRGDASVGGLSGGSCAAMLFSENWYGPYYWDFFDTLDLGSGDPEWAIYTLANEGHMQLAGACDTNLNEVFDPADTWAAWVDGGTVLNPLDIGEANISDLHLEAPFYGAFTTVEPNVALSGTVSDPAGFGGYPDEAVLYVVAQRHAGVADTATLDHEYGWTSFSSAELAAGEVTFTLPVPAYKEAYVWAWVDLDGDGLLNEPGEPGGASGPWYTDKSREGLAVAMTPATW